MGRRKLPMKRITDESRLQVIHSKRKNGLIKKAYELSVLCDVDVAFISVSGIGRVTSFSPTASIEDLFQKYMNGNDPDHDFSNDERERILRILHNIKMQNSHHDPQNDEILGLQEELRRKREELSALKDQLNKYQPKENEVIRSVHERLARERLLAQTLERVQQRLTFLYQNGNSLENSSQQLFPQICGWPASSSNNQNQALKIHERSDSSSNNQFMNRETTIMAMLMNNINDISNIDSQRQLRASFCNSNYQPFGNLPSTSVHANHMSIPTSSEANVVNGHQQIEGGMLGGDITSKTPGEDDVLAYLANLGED